ncbi:hypothetical protein DEU56DRAFT_785502 [Suillus clintonianus]|uniref:uncharacterized protein n=1 Tax=Suillus clintonianus TaxID=1904413 RepID=UPI001B86BF6C|nr:uncharacterized protein DEU56DRAFT_785502 [Suillus clintonianus]KAG2147702.1 hypothetical protein DEU56DRAFT_785502 [Suillus clintonianus]
MIQKFANPHLQAQDFEIVSRAQRRADVDDITDADGTSDVEVTTSKRKLHTLLFSEFGQCLSTASGHVPRTKKQCNENETTPPDIQDGLISFRLLSSTAPPRIISTIPKPPPRPKTRPPDCEDNIIQADERMKRAQSVAVDFAWLGASSQKYSKPSVKDNQKVVRMRGDLPVPHPAVMVTECHRHRTARRQTLRPPILDAIDSPHSLRATCIVLPTGLPEDSHHKTRAKAVTKKPSFERPPPAYWRPDSHQRGKCVGYALGYPGSWSVRYEGDPRKRWYVRDTMRKAAFST